MERMLAKKQNLDEKTDRSEKKTNISQRYFNRVFLLLYDFAVYRVISRFIWGCPNEALINRYKYYVRRQHLEVGVGTGHLIDKFNPSDISLDLMDLSSSCLDKSSKRLKRYSPTVIRHNVLETPIEEDKRYDSIGINYVLHCVSGDYTEKEIVFGNLKKLLKDKGVIFGSVVLQTTHSYGIATLLMKILNRVGVFNSANDQLKDLELALKKHFRYVSIDIRSSVVLFAVSDDERRLDMIQKTNGRA
jgi:2-polyprenyl-3-methyl-5-hydroxy-6-metoxy-1,4-benzoquinol methylase